MPIARSARGMQGPLEYSSLSQKDAVYPKHVEIFLRQSVNDPPKRLGSCGEQDVQCFVSRLFKERYEHRCLLYQAEAK